LNVLEQRIRSQPLSVDTGLRLACFLDWGLFRQRFSLEQRPALQAYLEQFSDDASFLATAPPENG
jgi:glutathione S-transferase